MKRFRFELDPLLRKHAWDVDILRSEKATASRAVEEQQRALDAIHSEIRSVCASLVQASGPDAEISIVQHQVIHAYVQHQGELASDAQATLQKAQTIEQDIADQLLSASQQLKTLEKVRDRAKEKHDYLQLRAEFNESDENWLGRHKPA